MCSTLNSCFSSRQSSMASFARHVEPLERLVGLDDLLHLGFDAREVFLGERMF